MKLKRILSGLTFFLFCTIYSQEKLELLEFALYKTYNQEFIDSLAYDKASGIVKAKIKSSVLKKVLENNPHLKGWIYYNSSVTSKLFREGKLDSILFYTNRAIELYNKGEENRRIDEHLLISVFYIKARAFRSLGNYTEAILNYQKSLDLTSKYFYKWKGYILKGIADVHLAVGNTEEAFNYYKQVEQDSLTMSIASNSISTLTRLGILYEGKDNAEFAKRYYEKAINTSQKESLSRHLPSLYGNLGSLLLEENKIDSTLIFYKKAIAFFEDTDLDNVIKEYGYYQLFYRAYVNAHERKYKISAEFLIQIVENLREIESLDEYHRGLLGNTLKLLTKVYAEKKVPENFDELSLEILKLIKVSYDEQLEKNVIDLELKYQTKEKDASILQLEETTQTQKTILQQRTTINWILGGLLLSFLGLSFLFFRQRQLKNKFVASNLEQRLLRSQLNPHFLYNALNAVSSLVQEKSENTIPYISKLGNLLRAILKNSRQEFVSLEEELETIRTYLELQSDFSKKFQYEIQLPIDIDQEMVSIPPMFIQPFIENAIQHGFQGSNDEKIIIKIQLGENDKTLHIKIQDNGIGYNESMKHKSNTASDESLSGKILQERLSIYAKSIRSKAYYKIKDLEKGTEVYLCLPYVLDI